MFNIEKTEKLFSFGRRYNGAEQKHETGMFNLSPFYAHIISFSNNLRFRVIL
jgi:hypothetical protein